MSDDKVRIIARLLALTGKGEPMTYWLQEAGILLTSLEERKPRSKA